jgi:hypothetical protein
MQGLTFEIGWLPLGLWIVLALLVVSILLGVIGQAISVVSWNRALAWGLQEDDPRSGDPMERSFFAVEWGLALADVVVQSIAIVLALYGLFTRHWIGLLGGTVLFTILVYYGLAYFLRCYAIKIWGLGDWTRWRGMAIKFLILAEATALLGLAGLWSNWRYFIG